MWCIIPCTRGLPVGVYLHVYPKMHPLRPPFGLILGLHLDIPSVVVSVHMLIVIHTTVCMYPYPIPFYTPLQCIHGVCIHSGGTCGRGPVPCLRPPFWTNLKTSILDLWSEWYPHLKPSIAYLTPYLKGGGVGVMHHTMYTWITPRCIAPCVPQMHPLEVLQRMSRSTTLKTVTRSSLSTHLRWSETTCGCVLMDTSTTMYGIPYPILHPFNRCAHVMWSIYLLV